MTPFLKDVADTLYGRHGIALKDFCFVTPNKRSGTFLRNYFLEAFRAVLPEADDVFLMPEIVTVTDFVARLSDLTVNSRIDNLFSLYNLYQKKNGEETEFERFRSWGEIALNDFNDVEMFCADADALFRNVKDFREISTDYLTEEQREVVEDYFPSGANRPRLDSFWSHFNRKGEAEKKYIQLWEILGDLFHQLKDSLRQRGLCLSGTSYREALKKIEERGQICLPYSQVVFVGFNALSTVEFRIFKAVREIKVELDGTVQSLADFYWDAAGEVLKGDNPAAHFMKKNVKYFKSKNVLTKSSRISGFPKTTKIISCPGNTLQVKVVSKILEEIKEQTPSIIDESDGVVVAMPDEDLFFPMLYSMPKDLDDVNITMGYPLKITAVYSWMKLFQIMHFHSRVEYGDPIFLRQDLAPFVTHPLSRLLLGSRVCNRIIKGVREKHSITLGRNDIADFIKCEDIKNVSKKEEILRSMKESGGNHMEDTVELIFSPLIELPDIGSLCNHLISILKLILDKMEEVGKTGKNKNNDEKYLFKKNIEKDNVFTYLDAVCRLRNTASFHKVKMHHTSAFMLISQLLSSERVNFSGEPLKGVQVMGMLETRSLDFENVIIMSMNERIFPRRLRNRSFIPNSLRKEFGLSTTRFQESIFAYYFYRMISRAENLYLLYDSRSTGLHSGDPSRYIYQLRYLYSDRTQIINRTLGLTVFPTEKPTLKGEKTPEVMQVLNQYLDPESGSHLSASSLKTYLKCPLQFFYKYVKKIKVREEEPQAFSNAQVGTIYHDTMNDLYESALKGSQSVDVTESLIDSWLVPDKEGLVPVRERLKYNILRQYLHSDNVATDKGLKGYAEIYFAPILKNVTDTLAADRASIPFTYMGGEKKETVRFPLDDDRKVTFEYIIDRIDSKDGKIRILDYKTGGDETEAKDLDDIFSDKHAIMQLLLYASLYDLNTGNQGPLKIGMVKPGALSWNGGNFDVSLENKVIDDHRVVKEKFEEYLKKILNDLFNENVPFSQCENPGENKEVCKYCNYKDLCNLKDIHSLLKNSKKTD